MHPLLVYVTSFVEINEEFKQQTNRSLEEVKQILGKQAPKKEIKNHFLKANMASYGSELHTATM